MRELIYFIPPSVLLAVIFAFTLRVMHSSDLPGQAIGDDVVIVGHQRWWEVVYPKRDARTANEIHIPAGQNVQFGFKSADVIHDFWVPELGRKMDMIPGRHAKIWLAAIIRAPILEHARSFAEKNMHGCAFESLRMN